jgi:hypothetical protein
MLSNTDNIGVLLGAPECQALRRCCPPRSLWPAVRNSRSCPGPESAGRRSTTSRPHDPDKLRHLGPVADLGALLRDRN